MKRLALMGALAVLPMAGCASQHASQISQLSRSGALGDTPYTVVSPTVFVAGETVTETLPSGQPVTLAVRGPLLTSTVKGKPVQFADTLVETFTLTATTTSETPVTLRLADFALERALTADVALKGPGQVVVRPGTPVTWKLAVVQTPGQGYLVWKSDGSTIAKWAFVAEND